MDLAKAKTMLPEIREIAGLASSNWSESYDTKKGRPEIVLSDPLTGEIRPIGVILPECSFDDRKLMQFAPAYVDALLTLLDEAFRVIRQSRPAQSRPAQEKPKDYAAECAMKCKGDHLFGRYLIERHDLRDAGDGERIKTRVRHILQIESMAELNKDEGARRRWISLKNDFKAWRQAR